MNTWVIHAGTALALAGLLGWELRSPRFRADSFQAGPRRRRNWTFFLASFAPMFLVQTAGTWFRATLPPLVAPGTLPFWADAVGCMLVAELVSWASHWVKHRHAFLWRFHFQHHREEHFNLWMVSHTHALEVAVSGTAMVALLAWLGFSPEAVQLYFGLYTVTLFYHHSEHDYSLGWLDWLVISPAYHRHHHRRDGTGNHGAVLTVFDVLFGTAHWPRPEESSAPLGLRPGSPEPYGFWPELVYFLGRGRGRS